MSFKLDDLEKFKKHRIEISESLSTKFIGREKEIDDVCNLLSKKDFVAITGPAGIGKSRLAVATIEKYSLENKEISVLCVKSFGDYISAIEESIEDSKQYLLLIDDANNLKRFDEVIECLKYHRGNVKAIFTVRDYLKDCIDDEAIYFYKISFLSDDEIKKAIKENTKIKNEDWLNKIANVSKGNMRLAFIAADFAMKDDKGFASLFNVKDLMSSFYKEQIKKMKDSNNLVISAGIISFFKSVYQNQLFYISPVLKIAGISKQEFLSCIDSLISMELVDECVEVVKISDQCFADYLLDYVFVEKKYLKIRDLIISTYKYYKKRIIESLNAILGSYLTDESLSYLKDEALGACESIEDVDLKHDIEVAFAPLALDYAATEFKNGVEGYCDKKDIKWLLRLFQILSKSEYQSVANIGIIRLLKKTNSRKDSVFKSISETYSLGYDDIKSSFRYLDSFVTCLMLNNIHDERFLLLVSTYLKYSYRNSKFIDNKKLGFISFNISDDMDGIIPFRKRCWEYVFSYGYEASVDEIINFAKFHITENAEQVVKSDLMVINDHLDGFEGKELIQAVLYEELIDDAKKCGFECDLFPSAKYNGILDVILKRKPRDQGFDEYRKMHEENVRSFYNVNKLQVFGMLKDLDPISKYYEQDIKHFLSIVLEFLDEFSKIILNVFIQYKVYPRSVVEKASPIIGYDALYEEIKSIPDTTMKEEYLYAFYSFINDQDCKTTFGFGDWIKSKQTLGTKVIFSRNASSLRKIAENSGILYLKLIKIIFKNRECNATISKEYLSYLFFQVGAFKELLDLDKDFAINVYEFLIAQKENDYGNKILKEIIDAKKSYVKTFAKRYLEAEVLDDEGLDTIIFNGDNCKLFFDTCIEIGKEKLHYFVSFSLQRLVSRNIENQGMLDWILNYINKNRNDDKAMEFLFSVLAGIDSDCRNRFIVKYYEKGKDNEVLRCALFSACDTFSLEFAESYYVAKIKNLESLKSDLIKWDNLNLIAFIDGLIEGYKQDIRNNKVSQLVEYVNPNLASELKEIDQKTEVSLVDAFKLYSEDENFRRLLSSGYISYKDGCFVTESDTPLKFTDAIKNKKIVGIKVVQAVDDIDVKYEQCLSSMGKIVKGFEEANQTTLIEHLYSLFLEKGWTANEFMQETALSKDLFSKIKNKQRRSLEKKTLIQILIGLRLPKDQRDYLIEKNQTQLSKYDLEDVLYDFMLASGVGIDDADALLKELEKEGFIKK